MSHSHYKHFSMQERRRRRRREYRWHRAWVKAGCSGYWEIYAFKRTSDAILRRL